MWTVTLTFSIAFFVAEQHKLQSSEFVQPFHKAEEGTVSFADNELFWEVCSRYFTSNSVIRTVTLQRGTHAVDDFSSVLLQQMYNHLPTPLSIIRHRRSSIKLHPEKHISFPPFLNNKSTNYFNSERQYGTPKRLRKDTRVQRVYRSGIHETGNNASPHRIKSEPKVDECLIHKTTQKSIRTTKRSSTQHVVSPGYSVLQKTELPICSHPSAERNNSHTRCYQPIHLTAAYFEGMKSLQLACVNYLIVAGKEDSVIGYFAYLTNINIKWNSKVKFVILLLVQFGYGSTGEFKFRCRSLLEKLWQEFRIRNVVVMTASVTNNQYVIYDKLITYDPFLPTRENVQRGSLSILSGSTSDIMSGNSIPTFYGYPLRVVIFQRFPTVLPKNKCYPQEKNCTVTYTGVDASLLYTLAAYLNFTPVIRHPSDGEEYGYATRNGTFTGAIGDIVYGRADISMNGMFIKVYGSDEIQFTHNAYSDEVCIIVPKAKRIPNWLTIFGPLDSMMALCVLGLYIINACFYLLINRACFESNLLKRETGWSMSLMEMLRPFVSSPFPRMPMVSSQRIFLGSCLAIGLVLTSAIQSTLVTAMTKPYYYLDVNSLEELDASGLSIYTKSPSLMDTFGSPHLSSTAMTFDVNPVMDRLSRRVQVVVSTINLWSVISREKNVAALVRKTDNAYGVILDRYRSSDGSLLLHVVRECPRHYLLGYLVLRGSPYLPYINDGIARLVEAGIVEHWKQTKPSNADMNNGFDATNLTEMVEMNNEHPKVFSLKDLQLAFYILAVGLSGSVIIFFFEIISTKKNSLRCH